MNADVIAIIAACALVTLLTRFGGYLLLARFKAIPARVAAGLEAVPVAIMTTLFAPAFFSGTWREAAALGLAVLLGLRIGLMATVACATLALIALRALT